MGNIGFYLLPYAGPEQRDSSAQPIGFPAYCLPLMFPYIQTLTFFLNEVRYLNHLRVVKLVTFFDP
jgi:hypothetical protein